MQVPTRVRRFFERYLRGTVPVDAVYIAAADQEQRPPCDGRQRLCSLTEDGPKAAAQPGGNIRWANVR